MAGIKSKIFNFIARNSHLIRGKLKKEIFDMDKSIIDFRERCEKAAGKYIKMPAGITAKKQLIHHVSSEWLVPDAADPDKVILYVHGGGYVSGSCNDHRGFVSKFAKYTGVINLIYEYRLAPENPFPSALDDSVQVYQWLLSSGYKPQNILITGESAGGGLSLAMLLALKELNIVMPAAAVAISPWTDLTCSGSSYKTKNRLSPAPLNSWEVFSKHYAGNCSRNNPLISPLFGDLKGLPPLFINSATNDELYDDGERFYEKARNSGVDITFRAGKDMIHCYPLLAPLFKEATEAMNEIVDFIKKHLKISKK